MFIQVIQGQVSDLAGVRAAASAWLQEVRPGANGWLGGTYGATDDGEFIAVVRFGSADAARRNSERPEQAAWWARMAANFQGDVTFRDYSEVYTMGAGGSDDAGFVQVMQGRVKHPARIAELAAMAEASLKETRPDVLGVTLAIGDDGHFTQTVAFESEGAAREGEMTAMPLEAKEFMEEFEDLSFRDLRHPWFESA